MRLSWIGVLIVILLGLISLPLVVHSVPTTQAPSWRPFESFAHPAPNSGIFKNNLLVNPSFEGGVYKPPESSSSLGAQGWSIWFIEARPTDHIPEWKEEVRPGESKLSWRGRHGDKAQKMFSSFATHQGGLYQPVNV